MKPEMSQIFWAELKSCYTSVQLLTQRCLILSGLGLLEVQRLVVLREEVSVLLVR